MNSLADRIATKIAFGDAPDDCWEWTASKGRDGYGRIQTGRRSAAGNQMADTAHRTVYQSFVGPIAVGLDIDHLCRNRGCVNPDHLEAVTRQENLRRGEGFVGQQSRQTHCRKAGHPLSGSNLRMDRGHRHCRACDAEWKRLRRKPITVLKTL